MKSVVVWLGARAGPVALLLAAVMAFALTPRPAGAHGGYAADPVPATAAATYRARPVFDDAAIQSVSAGLSRSCPAGPDSACSCGSRTACTGNGKTQPVAFRGWSRPVPLSVERSNPLPFQSSLQSKFTASPALPRAPPVLS